MSAIDIDFWQKRNMIEQPYMQNGPKIDSTFAPSTFLAHISALTCLSASKWSLGLEVVKNLWFWKNSHVFLGTARGILHLTMTMSVLLSNFQFK